MKYIDIKNCFWYTVCYHKGTDMKDGKGGSIMTSKELHRMVEESKGNESNICQIYAMKNGDPARARRR